MGRTHTADDENDNDAPLQAPYRPPEQQSKGADKAAYGRLRNPPTSDANNVSAARNYEDDDGPLKAPYRPTPKDQGDHGVVPGALAVAGIEEEIVTGENGPSSHSSAATSGRAKRAKRSPRTNQLRDTTPQLTDEEQPTSTSGPPVSLRLPTGGASIATTSTITGTTTEASAYSSPRSPSERDIGASEGVPFEAQLVPDVDEEIAERVQREVQEALKRVAVNAIEVDSKAENTPQILGLSKTTFYRMVVFLLVFVVVAVGVGVTLGRPQSTPITSNPPSPSPKAPLQTAVPTLLPTRYTTPAFAALIDSIGSIVSDDLDTLTNPETVQYKALFWLADSDQWDKSNRSTQELVERYALAVLYYSTNGPGWSAQSLFLESSSVCLWTGVSCFDGILDVQTLELSNVGATGTIPTELALLTNLEKLNLDTNNLIGTIPRDILRLAKMTDMSLGENRLTGTIPSEIAVSLRNLVALDLHANSLAGPIPPGFGSLVKFGYLDLSTNRFTGTIPTEWGILTDLRFFKLKENRFTGTIPSELASAANLQLLDLWTNQFTGTVPSELGRLTNLGTLEVRENILTGTIPSELGNATNLEYLSFGQNFLIGTIPSELHTLTRLKYFYVWNNPQLNGPFPQQFGAWTALEYIHIGDTGLSGTIPTEFGNFSNLGVLYSSASRFQGPLPSEIGRLQKLRDLWIGDMFLTGTIPTEFGGMTALERVILAGNSFTGSIDEIFCPLTQITLLEADCGGVQPEVVCSCCTFCDVDIDACAETPNGDVLGEWEECTNSYQCSNGCCSGEYSNGTLKCTPLDGGCRSDLCV